MNEDNLIAVTYQPTVCPHCGSADTKVCSTQRLYPDRRDGTVRYHKCLDCGRTFKSVEETGE